MRSTAQSHGLGNVLEKVPHFFSAARALTRPIAQLRWSKVFPRADTAIDPRTADPLLWFAVFALVAAGFVMVYSSSFIFAQERYKDGLYFFKRHLIFASIGIAAFLAAWRISLTQLKKWAFPLLLAVTLALVAVLIPGLGHRAGGASRWIGVFGLRFQPSEVVKLAVLLFVAKQLSRKLGRQENWRSGFLAYFMAAVPAYCLLLLQPDFGTVALLLATTFLVLLGGGIRIRYLVSTVLILAPTAALLIFTSPYRKARVLGFLDPWSDPAHKGFQIIQSLIAFYSGKWFGVGLGNSHEKLFYLPEAHNDFIFAVVGEEAGLVGVVLFTTLFLIVVWRGLSAGQRLKDPFQKGLALGISSLIGLQAFFNMCVVLGLLPTKGLPLPLISYGGTSLIVTLFMLGLLVQLSERSR